MCWPRTYELHGIETWISLKESCILGGSKRCQHRYHDVAHLMPGMPGTESTPAAEPTPAAESGWVGPQSEGMDVFGECEESAESWFANS